MEERDPQTEHRPRPRRKAPPKASPAHQRGDEPIQEQPQESATRSSQDPRELVEIGAKAWAPEVGASARPESRRLDRPDRREGPGGRSGDFNRLASENPRSAVLGALALGLGVGFLLGRLFGKD